MAIITGQIELVSYMNTIASKIIGVGEATGLQRQAILVKEQADYAATLFQVDDLRLKEIPERFEEVTAMKPQLERMLDKLRAMKAPDEQINQLHACIMAYNASTAFADMLQIELGGNLENTMRTQADMMPEFLRDMLKRRRPDSED